MPKKYILQKTELLKQQSTNLLLIFTRNPELGKCKTRLAATIGDTAALNVYKFLLQHTVDITQNLEATKHVYYSEAIWEDDVWPSESYKKILQEGENLGQRITKAFELGFQLGFKKIMVIGSDMYDLDQHDIETAFTTLDTHDFVIGPAEDGGYYLLGMTQFKKELFQNKDWGKETVLQQTLRDLYTENYHLLEVRNDIDLYEDIKDKPIFSPFLKHLQE